MLRRSVYAFLTMLDGQKVGTSTIVSSPCNDDIYIIIIIIIFIIIILSTVGRGIVIL